MKEIIPNIEHRYFKFKTVTGWKLKYFDKESKLFRYIRNTPSLLDSYISLNEFYDVKNVDTSKYPRVRKYYSVVDSDNVTKENVLEILKRLKENNLNPIYILQTSKNSTQILLMGKQDKKLSKILKGLDFDDVVLNDPKRVIRLVFSNHHSSFKTRFLNINLDRFEGIPKDKIKQEKKKHKFGYRFLRQRIDGIRKNDRSILYYKSNFLNIGKVKYLQRQYNIGDCYILFFPDEKECYGFLYTKCLQNVQLRKIQKSKYFIRISKKRHGKLVLAPEPKLLKIIEAKQNVGAYSYSHMRWLRRTFGVKKIYETEIGKLDRGSIGSWRS